MMTNHIRTLYRGHSYQVPSVVEGETAVTLSRLSLTVGSQCITSQVDEPWLFVDRSQAFSLRLTIANSDFLCGDDDLELTFYLYREGQSEPLAEASARMYEFDDFALDLPFKAGTFSYGNYFLLGKGVGEMNGEHAFESINGHLCFPFRLLPDGNGMHHPMPVSAELVRRVSGREEVLFSSAVHELRLQFSERIGGDSCFTVHCYTSGWKLMTSVDCFFASPRRSVSQITFRLDAGRIWFQGDYTAVLSHNMEPYALLVFRYDGRKVTSVTCRPLLPQEDAWWIVKHLEQEPDNKWGYIREFRGLSGDMLRLVTLSRMGEFNRQCREHGVGKLQACTCLSIASPDLFDARRLACLLPRFLNLEITSRHQVDCSDETEWAGGKLHETFEEREGKAFIFYNLEALSGDGARPLLTRMEQVVSDRRVFSVFLLCGTASELETLFALSPVLSACFPVENRLTMQPSSWQELTDLVCYEVEDTSLRLSPMAEHALVLQMQRFGEAGHLEGWKRKDTDAFLSASVIPAMQKRLQRNFACTGRLDASGEVLIQPSDVQLEEYLAEITPAETPAVDFRQQFEKSMRPLNELVGMNRLKQDLEMLFYQVCFNRQRKQLGLPGEDEGPYHMLLTGNPGTGKTTAAKLIGQVFRALGLLSKGEVITTDRSQLVGRYIGETEVNMQRVLEQARGNVLFIDEAYALCDSLDDRKDFGNHVIESLLGVLSEPHPDMVIIFAGYHDEMERLMQMNQGLRGRFPYAFHLEDYTAGELMQIAECFLSKHGYMLDAGAGRLLQEVISEAVAGKDRYFSNARWVNQLLVSGVLPAMAMRVMQAVGSIDPVDYQLIREEDVACAAARFGRSSSPMLVPRRRIGFTA